MLKVKEIFAKDIARKIEEVIKVDQSDEAVVRDELTEYVVTDSIRDHFIRVYDAVAEAPSKPHEGIGVWVSGFFGAGKSSFAKILGYTIASRKVGDKTASEIFIHQVKNEKISALLENINRRIATFAVIFDVSMERGVRTANERITEIIYKSLLRELDYAEDFDLAQLEIDLDAEGRLEGFINTFEKIHKKSWRSQRKLGFAINEASRVLHEMDPSNYPQADSWAKALGEKGRADINPNELAKRAFDLVSRRKPGNALIFIIDEVGQYISRSEEKMLDLQGVIQAFGRESKNLVTSKKAPSLCWIVVTSQEKLNEVVDSLESRRIQLAKLQDRFSLQIDLKQSDIAEVVSRRVLDKNDKGANALEKLYNENEGRLKACCSLERTGRDSGLNKKSFINLYPYLPYQIDLSIQIVSGFRMKRGVHRHVGGSNRTIIKQAQEMMVNPRTALGEEPIGALVTLDKLYELLYLGNLLPSELTRDIDSISKSLPGNEMALKVAKALVLLEAVRDVPRTPYNISVVLHPHVTSDSILKSVEEAIHALEEAQFIRESEDGYKLLSVQEKNWDISRNGLSPKPAEKKRILREALSDIFSDPEVKRVKYEGLKTFKLRLTVEGETVDSDGELDLHILLAADKEDLSGRCDEARQESTAGPNKIIWVTALNGEIDKHVVELFRSREMIGENERLAALNKLSMEEQVCLGDEKVRRDRLQRSLRALLTEALAAGFGFFRGVQKDGSTLGKDVPEVFNQLSGYAIPNLYPKLKLGIWSLKGDEPEQFLLAANLNGLPQIFYEENGLGLLTKQAGKYVPNLTAPICREVLDYLKGEHSYGNKVVGKTIENHFQGVGYGWDRDVLRLVLAVLLRGGAIEITHQGKRYRTHAEPASRMVFANNPSFRAATFTPREALDLKILAEAVKQFENITGKEVDVEEGAIAQGFQKLASEDRERLLPLVARMKALNLPGAEIMEEFLKTMEGIIDLPADDCVKTLSGEGKSYRELRERMLKLEVETSEDKIHILLDARRVMNYLWPVLIFKETDPDVSAKAEELEKNLASAEFYEKIEAIRLITKLISQKHASVYEKIHNERTQAFLNAVDEIKGTANWGIIYQDPFVPEETRAALSTPLTSRCGHELALPFSEPVCSVCRASISQMETEIAALPILKRQVLEQLRKLAEPEEKVEHVRVAEFIIGKLENAEDIDVALNKLKDHLLKLLATGIKIILE
jgi:hypothetical protein